MELIIKKNGEIISQEEFDDFELACNTMERRAWQYRAKEISALPEGNDEDMDRVRIVFRGADIAFVKVYDAEYVFEII